MEQVRRVTALNVIFLFACQIVTPVSASCAPYPILAKIGNVTISNGNVARGVALSVGTPEQEFAFLPQWPLNNVLVYGTNGYCTELGQTTPTSCSTFRGGQYNMVASSSEEVANYSSIPAETGQYPNMNYISDTLTLNDNTSIPGIGVGIFLADWGQQGYHPMMAFGLGQNSSVLNALKSKGKIASRAWSMFYGWTGVSAQTQLDGSFVFGGYDKAKVTGHGFNLAMTDNSDCSSRLLVTISDIELNFPNGTTSSLFSASAESFSACIVPDYPVLMTLPTDPYFKHFEALTNSTLTNRTLGLAYYSMIYSRDEVPYAGDITIVLQSGPSIRIPNHQLVVPDRYVEASSGQVKANGSAPNLVINLVQNVNAKDLVQLGRQFLSSAYIMVNQDAGEFTIWAANPTAQVNLVAVDEAGNDLTDFCVDQNSSSSSGPSPTASSSNTLDSPDSGTVKGFTSRTIGGIAGGAVAAVLVVIAASFVLCCRRRRHGTGTARAYDSNHFVDLSVSEPSNVPGQMNQVAGLPYSSKPELQGSPHNQRSLDTYQRYELAS